uniref:Uncharacterized protein n=1 Tax=Halyomorpha halys partiti-like virus 1 TaxID=3051324 RepID=A0AA49FPQ7_9VIRU|nr:MAG: hypothetical protein [Halyomorpha halys partiti-like virus 1]
MEAVIIPIVNETNFDEAASAFNTIKPAGTRINGIALVFGLITSYWSVNYEVVSDQFPTPSAENCVKAKAKFQSAIASSNGAVKDVEAIVIKPGGLLIRKWQVRYFVKMRAESEPVTIRPRRHRRGNKTLSKPDKRSKRSTGITFVKSTTSTKSKVQTDNHDKKKNATDMEEKVLKLFKEKLNQAKLMKSKISNTFIDKSNVFKFKANDIKRWFSPRKANFSFGLRRILHKQRAHNAERVARQVTPPKVKSESPEQKPKIKEVSYNAVAPGTVYEDIRTQEIFRNVFNENKEKIKIIAALFHIVHCKRLNHNPAHCGLATEIVIKYNLHGTKEQQTSALKKLQMTYNLTDEVLVKIHLVTKHDMINVEKQYLDPTNRLVSTQMKKPGLNFIGFAGLGFDMATKAHLACH